MAQSHKENQSNTQCSNYSFCQTFHRTNNRAGGGARPAPPTHTEPSNEICILNKYCARDTKTYIMYMYIQAAWLVTPAGESTASLQLESERPRHPRQDLSLHQALLGLGNLFCNFPCSVKRPQANTSGVENNPPWSH